MKPRFQMLLVAGFLLLITAGVVTAFVAFGAEALPKEKFDQVTIGMTETEVITLLGAPHGVRHDTQTATAFYYGGLPRWRWCTMEVFFGPGGRVTGKFHDH